MAKCRNVSRETAVRCWALAFPGLGRALATHVFAAGWGGSSRCARHAMRITVMLASRPCWRPDACCAQGGGSGGALGMERVVLVAAHLFVRPVLRLAPSNRGSMRGQRSSQPGRAPRKITFSVLCRRLRGGWRTFWTASASASLHSLRRWRRSCCCEGRGWRAPTADTCRTANSTRWAVQWSSRWRCIRLGAHSTRL